MLLDIGVGMLAALFFGEPLWLGILFSLLPDIDAVISFVRYRGMRMEYRHRDMLHLPLVFLAIGIILHVFSPNIAALFLVTTLVHFLHDSIGVGWGVQWLWPYRSDHYSFLYLYQPEGKPPLPKKYFYRFRHEDIDALDKVHGDPDWIRNIYVRMHPFGLFELAVFVAALAVLLLK